MCDMSKKLRVTGAQQRHNQETELGTAMTSTEDLKLGNAMNSDRKYYFKVLRTLKNQQ
jgi:hypothetical protein